MQNKHQNNQNHSLARDQHKSNRSKEPLIRVSQSGPVPTSVTHIPVQLTEVLSCLDPQKGDSYLDLTAGYGGHVDKILERTLQPNAAVLVDRDQHAIDYLHEKFAGVGVTILHSDFVSAAKQLLSEGKQFDLILADLGVSSPHLDDSSRGFSVRLDGPLDMRMDQSQSLTAGEIVNNYPINQLSDLIRRFGEEPRAHRIARLIEAHRPITTTKQLAEVVAKAWPGHSKMHPATRTFQALRIAVNDELTQLEEALPTVFQLLAPGGRIAIISFHSLEDRIVKRALQEAAGDRYDAELRLLTRNPISAESTEVAINPRARSAKLRAAAKIKKKGD